MSFAGTSLINSNKKSKQIRIDPKLTPDAAKERRDKAKGEFDDAERKLLELGEVEDIKKRELEAATGDQAKIDKAEQLYQAALQDREKAVRERGEKKKALETAEAELAVVNEAQGLLHKNADPAEASWSDLFRCMRRKNMADVGLGTIKLFDAAKKRGVVSQSDAAKRSGPSDVYFEADDDEARRLRVGQLVQFVMEDTPIGTVAKHISVLRDKA